MEVAKSDILKSKNVWYGALELLWRPFCLKISNDTHICITDIWTPRKRIAVQQHLCFATHLGRNLPFLSKVMHRCQEQLYCSKLRHHDSCLANDNSSTQAPWGPNLRPVDSASCTSCPLAFVRKASERFMAEPPFDVISLECVIQV